MDTRKFDDLTRSLGAGKSRRTVIKGLFGGVVGGIAIAGRPAYGALAQLGCGSDEQCAESEICCNGVCAAIQCCIDEADPNARCPEGTSCFEGYCDELCSYYGCEDGACCCPDNSCSADCCNTPINVLPATGSGAESTGGAWVAAAAVGGAAAYLAARKVRTPEGDTAE